MSNFNDKNIALKPSQRDPYPFVILFIVIVFSALRVWAYGNPRLSVAANDTQSYYRSSEAPLFSSEMWTGRRPFTTNLLYKIFTPEGGYEIIANGSVQTTIRRVQPTFEGIIFLQLGLSLFGWGLLAFVTASHLKHPLAKILSTITILAFAYTPQMADWDSVLMSESLTFSLFAILTALLIHMAFSLHKNPEAKITLPLTAWMVIFYLWTFLKDTNLLVSLTTIGMTAALFISPRFRKNRALPALLVALVGIVVLGVVTAGQSTRSVVQMTNVYQSDLLSIPERVKILQEMGMPAPNSPEYQEWFTEHSTSTLVKFMIRHPGYPIFKVIRDFPWAFTEIKQTYFNAPEQGMTRVQLMILGDALHPETSTPFPMTVFLLLGVSTIALKDKTGGSRPWAWVGTWLFLAASLAMAASILGDTWALNRHALFSTATYRLMMWVFAFVLMDLALQREFDRS